MYFRIKLTVSCPIVFLQSWFLWRGPACNLSTQFGSFMTKKNPVWKSPPTRNVNALRVTKIREQRMIGKRSTLYLPTVSRPSSPLLHLRQRLSDPSRRWRTDKNQRQEPQEHRQNMSCTMAGIIDSFSGEDSDATKTQDFDQLNLCFQNTKMLTFSILATLNNENPGRFATLAN